MMKGPLRRDCRLKQWLLTNWVAYVVLEQEVTEYLTMACRYETPFVVLLTT